MPTKSEHYKKKCYLFVYNILYLYVMNLKPSSSLFIDEQRDSVIHFSSFDQYLASVVVYNSTFVMENGRASYVKDVQSTFFIQFDDIIYRVDVTLFLNRFNSYVVSSRRSLFYTFQLIVSEMCRFCSESRLHSQTLKVVSLLLYTILITLFFILIFKLQ